MQDKVLISKYLHRIFKNEIHPDFEINICSHKKMQKLSLKHLKVTHNPTPQRSQLQCYLGEFQFNLYSVHITQLQSYIKSNFICCFHL